VGELGQAVDGRHDEAMKPEVVEGRSLTMNMSMRDGYMVLIGSMWQCAVSHGNRLRVDRASRKIERPGCRIVR
jgi:hypothetical protein